MQEVFNNSRSKISIFVRSIFNFYHNPPPSFTSKIVQKKTDTQISNIYFFHVLCINQQLLLMKETLHQLRLVVYPIIYMALYIPGGCLGFLPSTGNTTTSTNDSGFIYIYLIVFCDTTGEVSPKKNTKNGFSLPLCPSGSEPSTF